MNQDDIKKRIAELTAELTALRAELSKANEEKEQVFSRKKEKDRSISELVNKVRSLKRQRDEQTTQVRSLKDMRSQLSDVIRAKISEIRQKQGPAVPAARQGGKPAHVLKAAIEKLETRLETEALSPPKEKELMGKIKQLKKEHGGVTAQSSARGETRELSAEITKLRREADEVHAKVQEGAKSSQEAHEQMITISSQIDELRKEQKDLFEHFKQAKDEFNIINERVKERLDALNELGAVDLERKKESQAKKEARVKERVKQQAESVEEKIRSGKKLTTQDLIAWQASAKD